MMYTKAGQEGLNSMLGSSHPITINISQEVKGGKLATTSTSKSTIKKDGKVVDVKIESQTITVREQTINKVVNKNIKGTNPESQKLIETYKSSCKTVDQAIGVAMTHEAHHASKDGQLQESKYKNGETPTNEAEEEAREKEYEALEQTKEKNEEEILNNIEE